MFLMKSVADLLKVCGATLDGTVPRVAQLKADESSTWLDVAGERVRVVEHYDGNVCSGS